MSFRPILTAAAALSLVASAASAEIKIGASLPLTGAFSIAGSKHEQGYELCVELINRRGGILGEQVELIVSDNRSDPATAINQYERFINVDEVDAVFGTFSSRLSFPVANMLEKNGFVHPLPAGGALRIYTQGHEKVFYFQPNAAEFVGATLQNVIEDLVPADNRPATAAVVAADDFFANAIEAGLLGTQVMDPADGSVVQDMAPGFLVDTGIEIVYSEKWPEEGFNDWLNLANSIKRSAPEAYRRPDGFCGRNRADHAGAQDRAAEPKMVYYSQGTQSEFYEGTGEASEAVLTHTSWHPEVAFDGMLGGNSVHQPGLRIRVPGLFR